MDINFNEIFETSIFNSSIYTVFILEVTEKERRHVKMSALEDSLFA